MKKTLCSLVCLGALSLNADVLLGIDVSAYKPKVESGYKASSLGSFNTALGLEINIENFQLSEESGFANALKLGVHGYSIDTSDADDSGPSVIKGSVEYVAGYGFNLSSDNITQGVNILAGGGLNSFSSSGSTNDSSENFIIAKVGASYYGIYNNYFLNAEAFVKKYFDSDKKLDKTVELQTNMKLGYKFSPTNSGSMIGIKLGYEKDILNENGFNYGLFYGYMF